MRHNGIPQRSAGCPAWRSISRWISRSEIGLRPKVHQASPAIHSTHTMAGQMIQEFHTFGMTGQLL